MKIGFIGMGNMAGALAAGFTKSGLVAKEDISAYAPTYEKLLKNSEKYGFIPVRSVTELVKGAELIIMACKPYQIEGVLNETKDLLKGKMLLSVAAGWVFDRYEAILGDGTGIQCIMPNTPALVGEGVFLFEKKNTFGTEVNDFVRTLFSKLGLVEELPTELMGIGGAVSGCGPAFMDMIMEAYGDAAVKYGISRDTAYRLVAQTMLGSAKLQLETGSHPGVLKDAVCSPKGTTIRGVASLEKSGLRSACIESIDSIMK